MKQTAIVYGSTSGNCENIDNKIDAAHGLDSANVFTASQLDASKIASFDNLLLGSSTWGSGDLQDEWYDGIEVIKSSDLSCKTVAVFGCGDSSGFSTTYCDAMGTLYEAAKAAGADMIGAVSTDGYTFDDSTAVADGKFVGLALDEDNESHLTDTRIAAWVAEIQPSL